MLSVALALSWSLILGNPLVSAQDPETPLLDNEPFDTLYLKDDPREFRIVPLTEVPRRPGWRAGSGETLVVRMVRRPEQQYQIEWDDLERLEFFEERLLAVAARFADEGQFDVAYRHLRLMSDRFPDFPGLDEAWHAVLMKEAQAARRDDRPAAALSIYFDLADRDAPRDAFAADVADVVDQLVANYLEGEQQLAARRLLDEAERRFPGMAVVVRRRDEMAGEARVALGAAQEAQRDERWAEAHRHLETARRWDPRQPAVQSVQRELQRHYPRVVVAVRRPARRLQPAAEDDLPATWADVRARALLYRTLMEPVAGEGGRVTYASQYGTLTRNEEEGSWLFHLEGELSDALDLSGLDILKSCVRNPVPAWQERVVRADVVDRDVRWLLEPDWSDLAPWLQVPLRRWPTAGGDALVPGPYRLLEAEGDARQYRRVASPLAAAGQPEEIVERPVRDAATAARLLEQGLVQVVDRVHPWEKPLFVDRPSIQWRSYAIPTRHLLLVHPESPWFRHALTRRALDQSLPRHRIILEVLEARDEARILTSSFGGGSEASTDGTGAPGWFVPLMNRMAEVEGEDMPGALVVAHSDSMVAERAVRALREHWIQQGLQVDVRVTAGGPATADLLYVEVLDWAAPRYLHAWFRAGGPLDDGRASPVRRAHDEWQSARSDADRDAAWNRLVKAVEEEGRMIPLWSLQEHFAVHESLATPPSPVHRLYGEVNDWRVGASE